MTLNLLRAALAGASLCAFLCAAAPSQAQERSRALADPTRPPAILMAAAGTPAGVAAPAAAATPQLQSVLIASHAGGRHIAVIDGQTVRLGGKFKGATVARISETEVVLRRGARRQVLKLFAAPPRAPGPAARP